MEKIFFADLTHTGTISNADTFPLGMGFIASYFKREVGDEVGIEIFKFPTELNQRLLEETPTILCLSNFIWSSNLALAFAEYTKQTSPKTVIVMGGPNIALDRAGKETFLTRNRSIDFYICWEGERAFLQLYKALAQHAFDAEAVRRANVEIDNTCYVSSEGLVEGSSHRIQDLSVIPSPYTTGLFDKFFKQGLRPLIETQRGCPFTCTFCNESNQFKNLVRHRSADYLREELEYIASHMVIPCDLVSADNNFGMYPQDLEKARVIRGIIDKYSWPKHIDCSLGKNHPERVLECVHLINGQGQGILKFGSSLQSSDPEVLKAIQRRNLPVETIAPLVKQKYARELDNTKYFTEIILALPEDTKERHYESLRQAIDTVGMNIVNVHQLTLLPGTAMNSVEQRERYRFDSRFRVFVGRIGNYEIGYAQKPIAEVEEVVVGNAGMTLDEWLDSRVMSLLVKIYIDQDYFEEIFNLIKEFDLSCFNLLRLLQDEIIPQFPNLVGLVELFKSKTLEPLHDTYDEVLRFVEQPETVERHKTGELGGNELLVHRAKAYMHHSEDLHAALRDGALIYLERCGRLDEVLRRYVEEATRVSSLRKFDVEAYEQRVSDTFSFDFLVAQKKSFHIDPHEIQIRPARYEFYLSDGARTEIEAALNYWVERGRDSLNSGPSEQSQRDFNLGKLFHMGNLRAFSRSLRLLDQ